MNNRKLEFSDSLLTEFTDLQKEYIIKELYPSLKQALMHVSRYVLIIQFKSFTSRQHHLHCCYNSSFKNQFKAIYSMKK
jgi:hypothetical protein